MPVADTPTSAVDPAVRAQLFTEARSANTWTDEPVTDEQLAEIWEMARWAPTAANTTPMRVLYVRTPEGKQRLVPHMAEGNQAKTLAAPATAVLAADLDFHEQVHRTFPGRGEAMRAQFAADDDRRHMLARNGAWLQAGFFIAAVRAAGLAAGPMGGFDAAGIDAEFFAGTAWSSIVVVNIGRPGPDAWLPRLPRLPVDEVVRWA